MPTTITGSTGVSKVQDGVITVEDLNGGGSGSAPVFGCRAWVNFDGTKDSTGAASTANTARLIRASGNVTSVVRNGLGDYTVTFTTAMPDANYCPVLGVSKDGSSTGGLGAIENATIPSASALRVKSIATGTGSTSVADREYVCVSIFR
jgi:hypothetical protein